MLFYRPGLIIVDRFELRQELGAGGMGIVFGAMDRVLDEDVALKFLPPAMARDQDAIEQFTKEVKRARKVPGEYVLRVHDIWNDGEGGWFVSMEWAKGGDLTAYRRRYGTLSWDQAKTLLLPILQGLQAVHKAGIVHRDIKPANILFREDGTPVVADFGISKSIQASMSRISQDATISGTPAYMAPEAIRGGSEIGFHTDLYAIGCMAYELVTGHTPFVGDPMSVMYNQTQSDPSFSGMPPEAIRWIGACMMKDPARRVRNAEELIRGLEDPSRLPAYVPVVPIQQYVPSVQPDPVPRAPAGPPAQRAPVSSLPAVERTHKVPAVSPRVSSPAAPVLPSVSFMPSEARQQGDAKPKVRRKSANYLPFVLVGALAALLVIILIVILQGRGTPHQRVARAPVGVQYPPPDGGQQPDANETPDRPPSPPPPESDPGDSRIELIARLEEEAREHFAARRYTSPAGRNTWETCRRILAEQPDNSLCQMLQGQMQNWYVKDIGKKLVDGDCEGAEACARALRQLGWASDYSARIADCRARRGPPPPPPPPATIGLCPFCGERTEKGNRCQMCGKSLAGRGVVCPSCQKWVPAGNRCTECGKELP
ncbi:protein kinase [Candidatus Fermentibacteria bacterium]|nr:protein kinase [Candidatus Fermentibacteria bacterium]